MKNKTVKEIADELEVNKLRIYRFIDKENIIPIHTIKGVNYYDNSAQNLIKKRFVSDLNNKSINKSDTADNRLALLLKEKSDRIDFIEKQISEKDTQIKRLSNLLDQQQQLSLQDKNQLLELKERIVELEESKNVKKKKWYQFWL